MKNDKLPQNDNDIFTESAFISRDGKRVLKIENAKDPNDVMFVGNAIINTPHGGMPFNFPIEAQTVEEAFLKFKESADFALEQQKQRASKPNIIVPKMGFKPENIIKDK